MLGDSLASTANSGISGFDWINLFAAAASIVLAIVALALSIFFFVQGKNSADQSARSAEEISANVKRLEVLFNTLYSDTFSMMRETVTDMRQHVWKTIPGPDSADDSIVEAAEARSQEQVLTELGKVSRRVGLTDAKIGELRSELAPVVKRALEEQREATESQVENYILQVLYEVGPTSLNDLLDSIPASNTSIASAVSRLGKKDHVTWKHKRDRFIARDDVIKLVPRNDQDAGNDDSSPNAG